MDWEEVEWGSRGDSSPPRSRASLALEVHEPNKYGLNIKQIVTVAAVDRGINGIEMGYQVQWTPSTAGYKYPADLDWC